MAYLDNTASRADPKALAATIAIHAGFGVILVAGLAVSGVIETAPPPLIGEAIEVVLPPPPTPDDPPQPVEPPAPSQVVVPTPPLPLPPLPRPQIDTTEVIRNSATTVLTPTPLPSATGSGILRLPEVRPTPSPLPSATIEPTRPVPRGDPAGWVTTEDYRSRWINEGLTGTARFRLSIGKDGRVTDCRITRSTGHAALDSATCSVLERRARFTPSKDGAGNPVTGTYENAVVWRLPD